MDDNVIGFFLILVLIVVVPFSIGIIMSANIKTENACEEYSLIYGEKNFFLDESGLLNTCYLITKNDIKISMNEMSTTNSHLIIQEILDINYNE